MSTLSLDAVLRGLEDDRVTTRKTAVGDFGSLLTDAGVLSALNRAPGPGPAVATTGVMCWTREDVQWTFPSLEFGAKLTPFMVRQPWSYAEDACSSLGHTHTCIHNELMNRSLLKAYRRPLHGL